MAVRYEFSCRECGALQEAPTSTLEDASCPLPDCSGTLKRRWGFGLVWPNSERGH